MNEYPRWLYSRDHGSVVVDTPADAVNLPNADWYATPDFTGAPIVSAAVEELVDKRTKAYRDSKG